MCTNLSVKASSMIPGTELTEVAENKENTNTQRRLRLVDWNLTGKRRLQAGSLTFVIQRVEQRGEVIAYSCIKGNLLFIDIK